MTLSIDRPNNDVFVWLSLADVSSTGNTSVAAPVPCNGRIVRWFGQLGSSINNNTAFILATTASGLAAATPVTTGGTITLLSAGSSAAGGVPVLADVSGVNAGVAEGDQMRIFSSQASSSGALSSAQFCVVIRK